MTRIMTRSCENCLHWRPSLWARIVSALTGRMAREGRCASSLSNYRKTRTPRLGWCNLHMWDFG